jgi:catechol 2,3-dioxygenase-like lactoylglutathione lyase family enzyme
VAAVDRGNDRGAKDRACGGDDEEGGDENSTVDVETLSEPQTTGTGTTILFLRDPDGNLIEVLDA